METKPKERGKYKKHKTDSKITIKHYVNKKIKFHTDDDAIHSPLYVQVTVKRQTTFFKSKINTLDNDVEGLESWITSDDHFKLLLQREKENITTIANELIDLKGDAFLVTDVSIVYRKRVQSIVAKVNDYLTAVICTLYQTQYELNPSAFTEDLDARILEVHPLVLLNKWKDVPGMEDLKQQFSAPLWNFEYYYDFLRHEMNIGTYMYGSLEPTELDFRTGFFKEELLSLFSHVKEDIELLFRELKPIMELNSKYYLEFL